MPVFTWWCNYICICNLIIHIHCFVCSVFVDWSCFIRLWQMYLQYLYLYLYLYSFPRLPGRKIGSCFMSLRRLSCGLIASSVSATNWSWRPSIISSTFPSFPLKDRIFWNTTWETAKANIRLVWNWFDSSREKTLAGTWGEDTHSNLVMVAYFSRPLVTIIVPVNINFAKAIPIKALNRYPKFDTIRWKWLSIIIR